MIKIIRRLFDSCLSFLKKERKMSFFKVVKLNRFSQEENKKVIVKKEKTKNKKNKLLKSIFIGAAIQIASVLPSGASYASTKNKKEAVAVTATNKRITSNDIDINWEEECFEKPYLELPNGEVVRKDGQPLGFRIYNFDKNSYKQEARVTRRGVVTAGLIQIKKRADMENIHARLSKKFKHFETESKKQNQINLVRTKIAEAMVMEQQVTLNIKNNTPKCFLLYVP